MKRLRIEPSKKSNFLDEPPTILTGLMNNHDISNHILKFMKPEDVGALAATNSRFNGYVHEKKKNPVFWSTRLVLFNWAFYPNPQHPPSNCLVHLSMHSFVDEKLIRLLHTHARTLQTICLFKNGLRLIGNDEPERNLSQALLACNNLHYLLLSGEYLEKPKMEFFITQLGTFKAMKELVLKDLNDDFSIYPVRIFNCARLLENLPPQLHSLSLVSCKLQDSDLAPLLKALKSYPQIKTLRLGENWIELDPNQYEKSDLEGFQQLIELDISSNPTHFTPEVCQSLAGCAALERLYLKDHHLTFDELGLFSYLTLPHLTSLVTLDLSRSPIQTLSPDTQSVCLNLAKSLLQCRQLKSLNLSRNNLAWQYNSEPFNELLQTLQSMTNLRELDLSHNNVTELSADLNLLAFPHLQSLNLSGNWVRYIAWSQIIPHLGGNLHELDIRVPSDYLLGKHDIKHGIHLLNLCRWYMPYLCNIKISIADVYRDPSVPVYPFLIQDNPF